MMTLDSLHILFATATQSTAAAPAPWPLTLMSLAAVATLAYLLWERKRFGVAVLADRSSPGELFDRDERDTLEAIAANRNLEEVVERVAAAVGKIHPGARLAVLLCRPGGAQCLGNVPAEARRALERLDCCGTSGASWWAAPRVFEDVQADPIFHAGFKQFRAVSLHSCWTFPIVAAGRGPKLGVLMLFPPQIACPQPQQLPWIDRCTRLMLLAIEREQMAERLSTQSLLDPLTDLPNRMLTNDRLNQALKRARRSNAQLATLILDVDGFKSINDSIGNQQGDLLLKQIADRLRTAVRASDTLGRLGNDQFTLIAADLADSSVAVISERLLNCFKLPFVAGKQELTLTASIGVSLFPVDGDDVNALLRHADAALLHAKRQSRGGYCLFDASIDQSTGERAELESQLRAALQNRELLVYYQPQVDLAGQVVGAEALVRWKRDGHLLSPAKFIPIAEESGLIVPIGTWVLAESCRWAKAWQLSGRSPVPVSVNVSALQFTQDDFLAVVRRCLDEADLDPRWLEVEVTESLIMQHSRGVAGKLQKLRDMGVSVAIDDFGTGYSSLAYLQKLPIDVLKIDRSFVKDIPSDDHMTSEKTAVIRAILSMAHSLQLKVVAEGVENQTQLQFLRRLGCHRLQGFYFSAPRAGDDITAVIDRLNGEAITALAA